MPLIRKNAVQGHLIPQTATRPRGPFPPEILAQPKMQNDYDYMESSYESTDELLKIFRCKDCKELLYEDETPNHDCIQEEEK